MVLELKHNQTLFEENQRFHQPWILLVALGGVGVSFYIFVQPLTPEKIIESGIFLTISMTILAVLPGAMLPLFLMVDRLSTRITPEGIFIRLFPLNVCFHQISFDEIAKYYVRTYRPIREYGGWGIRKGSHRKAYIVSGNRGAQLDLSNGKSILIGSLKSRCLVRAIKKAIDKQ